MNVRQKIAIGVVDVLVIAELCVSMYLASQDQANFNAVFFKSFVVMLVPTLIAARIAVKRLRSADPEPAE